MSGLAAIFGGSGEKEQDSEKLLHLYWNRAQLKKQCAGMRREQYKLKDGLKQQEGATARLQQKLDHLEALLIDPESAGDAVVFYQLRGLALHCQRKLSKFAEQLKRQREQRRQNTMLISWNEERSRESKALEQELIAIREFAQRVAEQLHSERERLMSMSGFLKIFRRRSIAATLEKFAKQIDAANEREQSLLARLNENRSRVPPENQGLDVASKRSINFMIISFAQQLLLLFADYELAAMANEANEKSVGAINYGTRLECEQLLARIRRVFKSIEQSSDFASILQQRAKMISEAALFRNEGDAVPLAGSVSTFFDIEADGTVQTTQINLLGANYWAIAKTLTR